MTILITGATGFIGSHLKTALSEKHVLLTPGHKQLDLLDGDTVRSYFQKHSIDVVIHCAVIGGNRTDQYRDGMFMDNLRMFFNIVNCKAYVKKIIHISSGAVYDKRYAIRNVKEDEIEKRVPADEYGLFKYICSRYTSDMPGAVDLRVFGIFGIGEDYRHRFISNIICRHICHVPIVMNQNLYFDYIDIRDFADIVGYFISHDSAHTSYNIGTGIRRSLRDIADDINAVIHTQKKIRVKKSGLGNEYTCDISRLKSEIPSLHFIPFRQSLADVYSWYAAHKDRIDPKSFL